MLPTDADFNKLTRTVMFKVAIYLNGMQANPLEITRDNYLIDVKLLEEATSGDTPFDNPSSNELVLTLYSPGGLFNPANSGSTYYGKMKRNVCLRVYVRTSVLQDWYQLGEFFVTDWTSALVGDTATITADDVLYDVFGRESVDVPVQRNISVSTFITNFFEHFDITPIITPSLTDIIPTAYVTQENKDFLTNITSAYMLLCNVAHNGNVSIRSLSNPQVIRATLTDDAQILSIDAKLSVNSDYDAAYLIYYVPVESSDKTLLDVSSVSLIPGNTTLSYMLSEYPLLRLKYVSLRGGDALCKVTSANCTSKTIQLGVNNPTAATAESKLSVNGTCVEQLAYNLGTQGQNTLKMDNIYIQTATHAQEYLQILQRFVVDDIPILTAQIRGNPLLEIGDKVRLNSVRDNVDFTGILLRQNYHYDGGLVSDITLLNSSLVEEVTT